MSKALLILSSDTLFKEILTLYRNIDPLLENLFHNSRNLDPVYENIDAVKRNLDHAQKILFMFRETLKS